MRIYSLKVVTEAREITYSEDEYETNTKTDLGQLRKDILITRGGCVRCRSAGN